MKFFAGFVAGWAVALVYFLSRDVLHILEDIEYGPDFVDHTDETWQEIVAQLKGKVIDNG